MHSHSPITLAAGCLGLYGIVYFAMTTLLRVPETRRLLAKISGWARTALAWPKAPGN